MTARTDRIAIAAAPETVYALVAATERWPLILPHYRYVRVREARAGVRVVEMAAWRHVFPLHWVAEQRDDPAQPRVTFRHVAGPTRGMDVEWQFAHAPGGTLVTLEHRLTFAFPFAAEWLGEHVVGAYFIHGVARRTLACMKRLAEAAARA